MTLALYIKLFIETILVFVLVDLLQKPFHKIEKRFLKVLFFLAKVILTLYLALALIAFDYTIIWKYEYPFAALYLVLMADIFKDIIVFILSLFKKDLDRKRKLVLGIALTLVFAVYNIVNMETIVPRYHKITSDKLKNEYRLIFFADLHYGSSQSRQIVDKAMDQIKELHPDYLLLGGDLTDENTTKQEMEYLYAKIGSLDIPTFYIYGNHDRQERAVRKYGALKYTEEELERAIKDNGIRILYEDYEEINDDLIILGREDPSHPDKRKAVRDLPKIPEGRYVVSLDHTPYQDEEIKELKADLQLSGHTHAGQFFPVLTIYRLLGLNVLGDYFIGDTHLYVSSGIAGWALPLRSEGHSNFEVFDLTPDA